jgi:hypothetical protein
VVQGVALELLCRLLFTEGSNPSLSVPSPNSPILLTTIDQIAMDTIIPTVRPFFEIDSLFLHGKYWKENSRSRQGMKISLSVYDT